MNPSALLLVAFLFALPAAASAKPPKKQDTGPHPTQQQIKAAQQEILAGRKASRAASAGGSRASGDGESFTQHGHGGFGAERQRTSATRQRPAALPDLAAPAATPPL